MFFERYNLILLLSIALIMSLLSNSYDYYLRCQYPDGIYRLYKNTSFDSVDNEYYLSFADNALAGRGWRITMATNQGENLNPVGNGSYFRRVPGYSLIYFLFVAVFGASLGLKLVIAFHFFLYFLSVYCFYKILKYLEVRSAIQTILSLFYVIVPYFYSYTCYTLTESVSPYLTVYYLFFLLKAYKCDSSKKIYFYMLSAFFMSYAILTRPYMGIFGLALIVFLWFDYGKTSNYIQYVYKSLIVAIIPFLMIGSWAFRNYYISQEIVFLEKAYHPQSLDRMKPEFAALWNFVKCWEIDGGVFNSYQLPLFVSAINGDTSDVYIENIVHSIPDKVMNLYDKKEIWNTLKDYQRVIYSQRIYFQKNSPMPNEYSSTQLAIAKKFGSFTEIYKKTYPLNYYVITPLKYLKEIVLHSNTANIYYFQDRFRSNILLNSIRYSLVCLHVSLYLLIFFNIFLLKTNIRLLVLLVGVPVVVILFFVCIFQAVEQRYMLPFMPILFIGMYPILELIYQKLNKFRNARVNY